MKQPPFLKNKPFSLEEDKKKQEEKRKQLQETFLKKKQEVQQQAQAKEIDYQKEYLKLQKEMKKKQEKWESEIQKLNHKVAKQMKETNDLQHQLEEKKEHILSLKKDMEAYEMTHQSLHETLLHLRNQHFHMQQEYHASTDVKLKEQNQQFKTERNEWRGKAKHLENLYEQAKETLDQHKQKLGHVKHELKNEINILKKEVEKERLQQRELREKIENMKTHSDIKEMIRMLDYKLREDNVFQYDPLRRLLPKIEKVRQSARRKEAKKRGNLQPFAHWEGQEGELKIGYLAKEEEDWYFYTSDNQLYEVVASKPSFLIPDMPAKAMVYPNGTAYVLYCYSDVEKIEQEKTALKKELNKREKKENEKEEYVYFGDFSVLLVGSRNKTKYMERLKHHGVQVAWFNPFEESPVVLKHQMNAFDIILVCTSHVSHTVMNVLDKEDEKIQWIEKDQEDTIASRVRYTAIQLGLIRP